MKHIISPDRKTLTIIVDADDRVAGQALYIVQCGGSASLENISEAMWDRINIIAERLVHPKTRNLS